MATTHADLEPSRSKTDLSSKTGVFFMVLTILLGILCFSLSLIADATRSEVIWMNSSGKEKGDKSECVYNSNGNIPLLCAASAFVALGIAIVVEHTYMLFAMNKSSPSPWDLDSSSAKSLKWQAGIFFFITWICFAIAEILLFGGLIVELGHRKNWSTPRTSCHTVKKGLFSVAGAFGLTAVFLAAGIYLTERRAQKISEERANIRREVFEASSF